MQTAGFFHFVWPSDGPASAGSAAHPVAEPAKTTLPLIKMKQQRHIIFTAAALCSALLFACCTSRVKTQSIEPEEKSAFYTLSITRDSITKVTKAAITRLIVVDSRIRYQPDEAKTREPHYLSIEILYKNSRVVQAYTEHPLHKRFDLYSESGQIESKLISLQQGEVVFRVPYFGEYKKITVVETVDRKPLPALYLKHEK